MRVVGYTRFGVKKMTMEGHPPRFRSAMKHYAHFKDRYGRAAASARNATVDDCTEIGHEQSVVALPPNSLNVSRPTAPPQALALRGGPLS